MGMRDRSGERRKQYDLIPYESDWLVLLWLHIFSEFGPEVAWTCSDWIPA
jgi:hypothetical protein